MNGALPGAGGPPGSAARSVRRPFALLWALAVAGPGASPACAPLQRGGPGARPEAPSAAAAAEALAVQEATRITTASRLVFAWRAQEPDFRGDGTGVARVEPPDKARLDLFFDNGELAATAALVGDDLRVPAELPGELVPPPALFWAALGVFRPGSGATLIEAREGNGTMELGYRLPMGDRIRFRLRGHAVADAVVLSDGAVVERMQASEPRPGSGYPAEATYRNLRDYRELRLRLETFEHVDSFPPDIWYPGVRHPGVQRPGVRR